MNGFELLFSILLLIILFVLIRTFYLILKIYRGKTKHSEMKRTKPVKTIICIGSGGHTTEIIKLIEKLDPNSYKPRIYIMANNDLFSEEKVLNLETNIYKSTINPDYNMIKIPRSRIVNQSYFSSVFTTLNSILFSVPVVFRIKPDLILCNGPGTCIPICFIAFLMKILFICNTRIVFIESICRVETFSLTGLLLMTVADNIVVQWEELKKVCKRADYLGQLF